MRKKNLSFALIFVLLYINVNGQFSLQFSVKQSPPVLVNAGKDTSILAGSKIKIGGSPTATGGSGVYTYSWTPVTGLDNPALANPEATVVNDITYMVDVYDSTGCKKTDEISLVANRLTAVPAIVNELGLTLSPNPSTGIIYLKTLRQVGDKNIELIITDVLGRILFSKTLPRNRRLNETINLSREISGIYMLRLSSIHFNATFKILKINL